MFRNERISVFQFTLLVIYFIIGTTILIAPGILALEAKTDAWIPPIIDLVLGLLLIVLYNKMAKSFPKWNFLSYIDHLLGTWIGKIIAFSFFFFSFILSTAFVDQVGGFSTIQSLIETPALIINGLFIFVVVFGIKYGIETVAKSGEIFFPWVFLLLFFLLITLIPEIKTERMFPILEDGIKPILLGSYSLIGFSYFESIILLFIIPTINCPEKAGKALLLGTLIGGIVLTLITLYAILVLGGEGTARNLFPTYIMAKSISIAETIERIEAILAAIWYMTIYFKMAISFYCATLCLAHIFNMKDHKVLIYPLGLIIWFLSSYLSPNISYIREFAGKIMPLYGGTHAVLIPILLIGVDAFKKRRTKKKEPLHQ